MRNRFLLVLEAEDRRHGAEGLLARDHHVRLHVRDDRGFEKRAAKCVSPATERHLGALGEGIGDVFLDLGDGLRIDQRALLGWRP